MSGREIQNKLIGQGEEKEAEVGALLRPSLLFFFKTTGLCALSLPRQMAVRNAIEHIQEIIRNTITLFKTEKILTNVNWNVVEEKAKIEYNPVS